MKHLLYFLVGLVTVVVSLVLFALIVKMGILNAKVCVITFWITMFMYGIYMIGRALCKKWFKQ